MVWSKVTTAHIKINYMLQLCSLWWSVGRNIEPVPTLKPTFRMTDLELKRRNRRESNQIQVCPIQTKPNINSPNPGGDGQPQLDRAEG